jgi:hypothetical protein
MSECIHENFVDVYGIKSLRLGKRLLQDLVRAGFTPRVLFSVDWRCRTVVAMGAGQTPSVVYAKVGGARSGIVQWALDPCVFSSRLKRSANLALGKHLSGNLTTPLRLRYTRASE